MELQGLTASLKYLGVQMLACQNIPSEVKNRFFFSCPSHHEEGSTILGGPLPDFEGVYSTTRKIALKYCMMQGFTRIEYSWGSKRAQGLIQAISHSKRCSEIFERLQWEDAHRTWVQRGHAVLVYFWVKRPCCYSCHHEWALSNLPSHKVGLVWTIAHCEIGALCPVLNLVSPKSKNNTHG